MGCKSCGCVKVIAPFPPLNITRPVCAREFFIWLRDNFSKDMPALKIPFETWTDAAINELAISESQKEGSFIQIVN